jgi:hypothetical protein
MNNVMDDAAKAAEEISLETKLARNTEDRLLRIICELEFILRFCRRVKNETGKNPADSNLLALIGCMVDTIKLT